jgi:hypothetical protein
VATAAVNALSKLPLALSPTQEHHAVLINKSVATGLAPLCFRFWNA